MAINIAQKRAKKAQRRKQMVAEKRRAEQLEASLPMQVKRAAQLPVQACFLTEGLFNCGMGSLVLTRGETPERVALSSFLLDTLCLGIKDVTFEMVGREYFNFYMDSPLVVPGPHDTPQSIRRRIELLRKHLGDDGFSTESAA